MLRFYKQLDAMDCGPACLRMIAKHYGKTVLLNTLKHEAKYSKSGVSMLGLSEAAEKIGFRAKGVKISFDQLIKEVPLPAILHWQQYHFVVLVKNIGQKKFIIADPAVGIITVPKEYLLKSWLGSANEKSGLGTALLLETTAAFYKNDNEKEKKAGWSVLLPYLNQNKKFIFQLIFGLAIGSLLQLIFPFLTQSLIDIGINTHNLQFIYIILIAEAVLLLSRTLVEFIRSRILLYISTRINISLLSDFWSKMLRLPLSYFDTKLTGDILQRIQDQRRIESFLTSTALSTIFSVINIIVFSVVLLLYNRTVFLIFATGSILYVLWIRFFLRQRRNLDYKRFAVASKENSATMQLIYGMQEIKLNGAEKSYRWQWENLQTQLFNLSFKSLSLSQYQQAGAIFINEGKNILVTFLVAKAVLDGQLTLGAMLAIQYILGQLNSPVDQLVTFVQQAQDAKMSLERLDEIYEIEDEEKALPTLPEREHLLQIIQNKSIQLTNLSFTYAGAGNQPVLNNINFKIPKGKVTAIVGMSGSGKTTLLKLFLKFYNNYEGEIIIGDKNLRDISPRYWRSLCGTVMQDGFIFNDSIAKNIAVSDNYINYEKDDNIDYDKLLYACQMASILPFIESLPSGFNTIIGSEGNGISAGQRQRILIARAVYKNPSFIFFDEATNALDSNNERVIIENLQKFFKGKTVVVVAHRLSTVKHADNIVVLDNGEIIEQGTHSELSALKGNYYNLVRNQLELGN
ncbi:MAG: peptidase domain-containing ABC transporter [Ginsengibacter sp.]